MWGVDLEWEAYKPVFLREAEKVGYELFKDDARFQELTSRISPASAVIHGIGSGMFKDAESGKSLTLRDVDEGAFSKNAAEFLRDTSEKYNLESLLKLRELAQEERASQRFAEARKRDIPQANLFERIVDHAVENSKRGLPTILDMVPVPDGDVQSFKERLVKMGHDCPTQVVLVHLPLAELTARMEARNKAALAEGGNPGNQRDGSFPFRQYGEIFGASDEADRPEVARLAAVDVYEAAEKFGESVVRGVKIRDMSQTPSEALSDVESHQVRMAPVFETLKEGKKMLDKFGFEDGSPTLEVKARVAADVVYDHSTQTTAEIAEGIHGWMVQEMRRIRDHKTPQTFVEKMAARPTPGGSREV